MAGLAADGRGLGLTTENRRESAEIAGNCRDLSLYPAGRRLAISRAKPTRTIPSH